jgi:hypothetical protein
MSELAPGIASHEHRQSRMDDFAARRTIAMREEAAAPPAESCFASEAKAECSALAAN